MPINAMFCMLINLNAIIHSFSNFPAFAALLRHALSLYHVTVKSFEQLLNKELGPRKAKLSICIKMKLVEYVWFVEY